MLFVTRFGEIVVCDRWAALADRFISDVPTSFYVKVVNFFKLTNKKTQMIEYFFSVQNATSAVRRRVMEEEGVIFGVEN